MVGLEKEIDHPNAVKEISSLQDMMGAFRCIYIQGKLLEMSDWRKFFGKENFLISKNGVLIISSVFTKYIVIRQYHKGKKWSSK